MAQSAGGSFAESWPMGARPVPLMVTPVMLSVVLGARITGSSLLRIMTMLTEFPSAGDVRDTLEVRIRPFDASLNPDALGGSVQIVVACLPSEKGAGSHSSSVHQGD